LASALKNLNISSKLAGVAAAVDMADDSMFF